MILLQGSNLARHFGPTILFEHVHVVVQEHARIALVGRNGAGKSTLLKILAGVEAPDEGVVSRAKEVHIGYLAQHSMLESTRSVWQEMVSVFEDFLQLQRQAERAAIRLAELAEDHQSAAYEQALKTYEQLQQAVESSDAYGYESEIKAVLAGLGFANDLLERSVSALSGGQKTRLALAKLLLERHDVLILDEPTNHLDLATLSWLETYLQQYKGALVVVSHDRYFLDKWATEVYEIEPQGMATYRGNYSQYLLEKEARWQQQLKLYKKQQAHIAKLEDFVARNLARASTTKRAQSRRKQLEKLERIEKPQGPSGSARFQFACREESGNVVLQLDDVAIGYQQPLVTGITGQIRKQQAVAIVGANGVGKSTLLKTITQHLPVLAGTVKYGAQVHIGYYDQDFSELTPRKTVLQELWDAHPLTNEKDIRTILGSFLFRGTEVEKPVAALSGGELARLSLAKLAMDQQNFLLLDEPTNHLDIDSKEVLEDALIAYDGTILFVSHDRYFINRIATSVLELTADGGTWYLGDYDYYISKKAEQTALAAQTNPTPLIDDTVAPPKQAYQDSKQMQRQKRQLERQLAGLEERLAAIEAEQHQIEQQLMEPQYASDHAQLNQWQQALQACHERQEQLLTEWEQVAWQLETEFGQDK